MWRISMENKILKEIKKSKWWEEALKYPDRHYPGNSGVMLSDHLVVTQENIQDIFANINSELEKLLSNFSIDVLRIEFLLEIVALLHDIWKPQDNKNKEYIHPISQKKVKKRHNILWIEAAIEMIWASQELLEEEKQIIYHLIDEHDTPFSWYMNFLKTWQIPKYKSWKKLDQKISGKNILPLWIILLAIFKIADIDWHDDTSDVSWFIKNLNNEYLKKFDIKF